MKNKYLVNVILCVGVILYAIPVNAAKGGIKGPAAEAYLHANDNASFKDGNLGQIKKGNKELKKLDKQLEKEYKHEDINDKDTQLEKSLKKESKKAIRKAIK